MASKGKGVTGLQIGAREEAVRAARDAILQIIDRHAGDVVTIKALETLTAVCEVKNVTITQCTFDTKA